MLTLSLLTFIACSGDKEDTAIEETDTSTTEETGTEETDTEETDTEETDTPPGNALVRVVHASPDAPPVDVFVNGEASGVENFAFKNTTGYLELPAGTYSFAVAPVGAGSFLKHCQSHWMLNLQAMVHTQQLLTDTWIRPLNPMDLPLHHLSTI